MLNDDQLTIHPTAATLDVSPAPPLFITGCPRSGTTMLAQMVSDTVWGAPFETQFIVKYHDQIVSRNIDLSNRRDFNRIVDGIASERPVMQSQARLDANLLYDQLPEKTAAGLFDAVARAMRKAGPQQSWGDKTPHYTLRPDVLIELYPDSKVIYIVRDGRDVALSLMRKNWGPANFYSCARLWQSYQKAAEQLRFFDAKGQLLTVKYEELLEDPMETSNTVLNFLGYQPGIASQTTWLQTLKPSNFNKWHDEMSMHDTRIFEAVAGESLEALGYDLAGGKSLRISTTASLYYRLQDRAKHYKNLLYINTIESFQIRYLNKAPFAD